MLMKNKAAMTLACVLVLGGFSLLLLTAKHDADLLVASIALDCSATDMREEKNWAAVDEYREAQRGIFSRFRGQLGYDYALGAAFAGAGVLYLLSALVFHLMERRRAEPVGQSSSSG